MGLVLQLIFLSGPCEVCDQLGWVTCQWETLDDCDSNAYLCLQHHKEWEEGTLSWDRILSSRQSRAPQPPPIARIVFGILFCIFVLFLIHILFHR